jgi:Flp pilus assembly protein TadG
MNPRRNETGQAIVLTTLAMVAFVGMCAFVLDAGSWFRTDRRLQATADAAALAGAQMLPGDPSAARSTALSYADKNGGDVADADITITSTFNANDTIRVKAKKTQEGIFSKVLGIDSADIEEHAVARVDSPAQARYVAPMTVYCGHPKIQNCDGNGNPKFGPGHGTEMEFDKMGAPGAFGMLNLNGGNGTPGTSEQAEWILRGFDQYLDIGIYRSNTGAKFSSSEIQGALDDRIGTVLLFPVFKTLEGEGQNAEYDIIGWIGFHLTSYEVHGHNAVLSGWFTEFIAQGVLSSTGSGIPSTFGVKSIQLIE